MKSDHRDWSGSHPEESGPRGGGRRHHGPFRRHGHGFAHHPGPGMGPFPRPDGGPFPGPGLGVFGGPPPMGAMHPGPVPPGGPGPWAAGPWGRRGRPGGGRGRAGRGDVRTAVLLLLADADGPMHGYQLMQAIAERTGGAWQPSPGAVYPTISQLEDEGLVTVTADGGRRLVTLTDAGREHVTANRATLGDPFAGFTARAGGGASLIGPVQELHAATWQVARTGDADQITAAHKILTDARRALYLILAGEPTGEPTGDSGGPAEPAAESVPEPPAASASGDAAPATGE
ncbi:PadR family transcriptional regulator [Pseudofrankia asymbiotica]|uniref:PadR family transcriptional regulator n=1 Tax=Pseudofrankia asymbiotica TaxID=1834516 RepID=A0A1V2ID19_9ACTN|nr:PadR family transcriptional regulator [Pseudofrankia asymbiotica]ONH30356.1 PadR family transcriptional regulator [Pseudofrankia asymbiotica]